jgi:hypothetical protein
MRKGQGEIQLPRHQSPLITNMFPSIAAHDSKPHFLGLHIQITFKSRAESLRLTYSCRAFAFLHQTSSTPQPYPANMPPSRIVVLAKEIEANTIRIDEYLAKKNLPPPSFGEDAPLMYQFPPDIAAAQEALSAAIDELSWLNQGPMQTVVAKSVCFLDFNIT